MILYTTLSLKQHHQQGKCDFIILENSVNYKICKLTYRVSKVFGNKSIQKVPIKIHNKLCDLFSALEY